MTIVYKCDFCNREFTNEYLCKVHEFKHSKNIKDELINNKIDICDYCDNGYYVYGCEFDCEFRKECDSHNNYKKFIPVYPMHNKRKNGGV